MYPYNVVVAAYPEANLSTLKSMEELESLIMDVVNGIIYWIAKGDDIHMEQLLDVFSMKFLEYQDDNYIAEHADIDVTSVQSFCDRVVNALSLPTVTSQFLRKYSLNRTGDFLRDILNVETAEMLETLQIYTTVEFASIPYDMMCKVLGWGQWIHIVRSIQEYYNPRPRKIRETKKSAERYLSSLSACVNEDTACMDEDIVSSEHQLDDRITIEEYFKSIPYTHVLHNGQYVRVDDTTIIQDVPIGLEDQSLLFHSYCEDAIRAAYDRDRLQVRV